MKTGKLICELNYWEIALYILGWSLLTVITLGIALPFFGFWMFKYCMNHTNVEIEL